MCDCELGRMGETGVWTTASTIASSYCFFLCRAPNPSHKRRRRRVHITLPLPSRLPLLATAQVADAAPPYASSRAALHCTALPRAARQVVASPRSGLLADVAQAVVEAALARGAEGLVVGVPVQRGGSLLKPYTDSRMVGSQHAT